MGTINNQSTPLFIQIHEYINSTNTKNKEFFRRLLHIVGYVQFADLKHIEVLIMEHFYNHLRNDTEYLNKYDLMVNASRLWNSICETENKKFASKSLSRFLKSKRIQKIKEQFNRNYPNESFYTEKIKNIKQPQFNGIYVHHSLVQYIIEYLDTKRARFILKLIYKQFEEKVINDNDYDVPNEEFEHVACNNDEVECK